jgi:signal transduction histidine kinase
METEPRYKALYSIAKDVISSVTPDEVLNSIVKSVAIALDAKGCSLMLLSPDGKQLIHTVSYGLSERYLRKGPVKSDTIINQVLKGKSVAVLDATKDPRVQYKEQAAKEGITSMLSVPLLPDSEVTGIMRIYTSEPRQFSPDDVDFLGDLANLGALALGKAKSYEALGKDLEQCSLDLAKLEEEKNNFLRFLGIAAHDLKAPLTAIQGFLWVMLRGLAGELNDKQKNMLERSSRRIDELLQLISDLLDIPRIETGQLVQEMKVISLGPVIKHCLANLREQAKQKGIKLKLEMPSALHKVCGSGDRLGQVLNNLVSNAINYTNEGEVTVRVIETENEVQVAIIDTGIGIPTEEQPHLFKDFFRASNVTIKGTGLGLSISRRIIEAHGGRIWAESPNPETKVGSKFTFTLPKCQARRRQRA